MTGSLLLSSAFQGRYPEDLDVNVRLMGSSEARTQMFGWLIETVSWSPSVPVPTGRPGTNDVTVYSLSDPRVEGRTAEYGARYDLGYFVKKNNNKYYRDTYGALLDHERVQRLAEGEMTVDLEIKDTGGAEWTEHLNEEVTREATDTLKTKGKWLLVDVLNRVYKFHLETVMRYTTIDGTSLGDAISTHLSKPERDGLSEATQRQLWKHIVINAAIKQSQGKDLFNKVLGFGAMALAESASVSDFLCDTVKPDRLDVFETVFESCCSGEWDSKAFHKWLTGSDAEVETVWGWGDALPNESETKQLAGLA